MDPKKEAYQEISEIVKENLPFKEMRKKLKEKVYDLDAQDENGKTALMNFVENRGYTEQMWVLLDYGADPNITDKEEKTALHYACAVDKKDMIICLLLFGADPDAKDIEGHKPFDDYRDDLSSIFEKINEVKKEFISLTRKRRKYLKYIFDEIDKELGTRFINVISLKEYYIKINKEKEEDAEKDARMFITNAKLIKSQYGEDLNLTYEEFVIALSKIAKIHGMKVVDEFIGRFKKIYTKTVHKQADAEGDKKEE